MHVNAIPPPGLVLLSIVSIQVGAALATHLFPILGAEGTVAVRIIFSALLLGLAARTRVRTFGHTFLENWRILLVFGLCIAAMNLFFYQSIDRIPLGAAVAIEFVGPFTVAASPFPMGVARRDQRTSEFVIYQKVSVFDSIPRRAQLRARLAHAPDELDETG